MAIPVVALVIYGIYGGLIKQSRILPEKLQKSFLHLPGKRQTIVMPNRWEVATNPGVIKWGEEYLMVYRAESISFWDYVLKHLTFNRNKRLGLRKLDSELRPLQKVTYLEESAPGISKKKQSPNDPRLIEYGGRVWAFYNDRVYLEHERKYVRQMYLCEVFEDGFGVPKHLTFPQKDLFTDKGQKLAQVEKNWTPFVHGEDLYLIYLLEPFVVLKVDVESGLCKLIQENASQKVWDFGLVRGGTPCIRDNDHYLGFFHAPYPGTCLGHSHSNIYVMGAYWFSGEPPFTLEKASQYPLCGEDFYTGLRKLIFPTALIDEGEYIRIFYGKDDKSIESWKVSKKVLDP